MSRYEKPARCLEDNGEFKERVTDFDGKILRECKTCTVRQWCDRNGNALGTPANAFLRRARIQAHAWFDDLWRKHGMRRKEAYAWLKAAMGSDKPVHMAEMTTEQCMRVTQLVREKLKGDQIHAHRS